MKKFIAIAVLSLCITLLPATQTFANTRDRGFSYNFKSYESQATMNSLAARYDIRKSNMSSAYIKNVKLNNFYLDSIREYNGGAGVLRSTFKKFNVPYNREGLGYNTVKVGKEPVPRLEKGPSGSVWYIEGLYSPNNYQGYQASGLL